MILPFMSFTWSEYGGRYAQPMIRVVCDWANSGRIGAQHSLARPKGRRVVLFQNAEMQGQLFRNPADHLQGKYASLWWPNGIAATKFYFGRLIEQFFANKGDLDFAVFDIESHLSGWVLRDQDFEAIYNDPRYKALAASGRFPADCRNMNRNDLHWFNYGCAYLTDVATRASLIEPLYARYNNVNWSNYEDSPKTKADGALVPDLHGNHDFRAASGAPYYSPATYAHVGNLALNDARFKQPYYCLAWMCNSLRVIYRAKASAKIIPWVATRSDSNVLDLVYWQEYLFHACCLCGPNLFFFNAGDATALSNWRFDNAISQY
ncbi:MAG TPA: hypothetical protein VF595_17525, partial [Tepidisphaeraceae bacterium]